MVVNTQSIKAQFHRTNPFRLNPLDLADCDLVFGPVVKFSGPVRLMRGYLLGMLEPASILQVKRHTVPRQV
jgi:hypothetical protein